ncbi:hypothetical protein [Lentzea sp. NPDC092896]|uniref:hypothetical protein n=1 Tax=Lentzea sp. NPDC092896 TaxID=3364127 RepID=UPI00381F9185
MSEADLAMLAYDIADLLQRGDYSIDVADVDILPELPGFIAAITLNAQNTKENR